ncbi:MAG: heat-inducible transcription repressor HrcA [Gammaproteobacteria bacterium]|nr:heat-inducible transcription repressor HrcA [Gammaproteobacteria bacterium]
MRRVKRVQSEEGELDTRARTLLKRLIECYISDGQPIGSRTLANESELDLSSATIRNVMSLLDDEGYITSPHTSSGRIPTAKGYRFFIDKLMKVQKAKTHEFNQFRSKIEQVSETNTIISMVSEELSHLTSLAGVVMIPIFEQVTLRQIEFLPISGRRILVILVTNDQNIQNRIINIDGDLSRSQLEQAANYLNSLFFGKSIHEIRSQLLQSMERAKVELNAMMSSAIKMAEKTFSRGENESHDCVIAGQTNLMEYSEIGDLDKLRQLFDAFNQKREILHLFDKSLTARGVQIYVGQESGYKVLDSCSIITSPYHIDGEQIGVLGVIGPTRMAYDRVVPIVDITAKVLGSVLNHQT